MQTSARRRYLHIHTYIVTIILDTYTYFHTHTYISLYIYFKYLPVCGRVSLAVDGGEGACAAKFMCIGSQFDVPTMHEMTEIPIEQLLIDLFGLVSVGLIIIGLLFLRLS